MVQYQVTAVLSNDEELERFVVGQRLARDESRRLAWERHYRDAEKKLEDLKSEINRLTKDKEELERRILKSEEVPKQMLSQKIDGNIQTDDKLAISEHGTS